MADIRLVNRWLSGKDADGKTLVQGMVKRSRVPK